MVNADALRDLLYADIPLVRAMGIEVVQADPTFIQLTAPLAPNRNSHGTVFGGSANALAILAAWSLLHVRLGDSHPQCRIVIQQNGMCYERPLTAAMTAHCTFDDESRWTYFLRTLNRHGRARLGLMAEVSSEGRRGAMFEGEFVVWCRRERGADRP